VSLDGLVDGGAVERLPLAALADLARPPGAAKYLQMTTFENPRGGARPAPGWCPWPHVEGLAIAEATTELTFVATGRYGGSLPRQNGAPLRLAVP